MASVWEGALPDEGYFACERCGTTYFRLKDTILDAGQNSRQRRRIHEMLRGNVTEGGVYICLQLLT